jgi:chorismate mutase / prephenate dehydratase
MNNPTSLDDLRRRIDQVDDGIHDLILERAELVEAVAALKQSTGQPAFRPGREAAILRRLVARHRGRFPRPALVRLWRDILGGTVAMQGKFVVAVALTEGRTGSWEIARDHFGGDVQMLPLRAHGEVLSAVSDGRATVGVLPLPSQGESEPWWPALAGGDPRNPRVVARLPFAAMDNARPGTGEALVIGTGDPDPTGADSTLLVIETEGQLSRARLLSIFETAGRRGVVLAVHEPVPGMVWHLIELDDLLLPGDETLTALLRPLGTQTRDVRLFGIYARPLSLESI